MFSLRSPSSCKSSSEPNEDCFGWWIGTEPECQETTAKEQMEKSKDEDEEEEGCPNDASSTTSSYDELCQLHNDSALDQTYNLVEHDEARTNTEEIELDRLDSGFEENGSANRQALCYTPERMVKHEEFKILAPSPRFFSPLENLTNNHKTDLDDKGIRVASYLASLFLDTRRSSCRQCCEVGYGDGEVLLHNTHEESRVPPLHSHFVPYLEFGSCYELRKRLDETSASDCCSKELLVHQQDLADDTSGVSSADGVARTLHEDDWSGTEDTVEQTIRRLSDESNYESLDYAHTPAHDLKSKSKSPDIINEVVSILADLENDPARVQALLVDDDRFDSVQSKHDCFGRLALSIEPDDKTPVKHSKNDPEAELERLYDKIERLQSTGKDIWEEIHSLKRSFTNVEWKVNHISKDIKKLNNEFIELRFLDDLLKLLKGNLEEISKRNWPFAIGNVSYGTEEVNLVI